MSTSSYVSTRENMTSQRIRGFPCAVVVLAIIMEYSKVSVATFSQCPGVFFRFRWLSYFQGFPATLSRFEAEGSDPIDRHVSNCGRRTLWRCWFPHASFTEQVWPATIVIAARMIFFGEVLTVRMPSIFPSFVLPQALHLDFFFDSCFFV